MLLSNRRARRVARSLRTMGYKVTIAACQESSVGYLAYMLEPNDREAQAKLRRLLADVSLTPRERRTLGSVAEVLEVLQAVDRETALEAIKQFMGI